MLSTGNTLKYKQTYGFQVYGWRKTYHDNTNKNNKNKRADFKVRDVIKDK